MYQLLINWLKVRVLPGSYKNTQVDPGYFCIDHWKLEKSFGKAKTPRQTEGLHRVIIPGSQKISLDEIWAYFFVVMRSLNWSFAQQTLPRRTFGSPRVILPGSQHEPLSDVEWLLSMFTFKTQSLITLL
jgi:hypothetical protein